MDVLVLLVIVMTGVTTIVTVESRASRLDKRIRGLERKLDVLLDHWGLEAGDAALAEVVALARAGNDVAAIRKYREVTGAGLLEAKQAVDRMSR
ncbi:hypothetical protein [Streptomyces sp. NPDC017202]|uniref:hypothetical protein n=1 Tax=Streptomyces sp. NPDC017202 TaxID=3364981 RepID=UPI0037939347